MDTLLRQELFSAVDLGALDAGKAVVKSLDTPVRQELAHFGAVYIEATTDRSLMAFDARNPRNESPFVRHDRRRPREAGNARS